MLNITINSTSTEIDAQVSLILFILGRKRAIQRVSQGNVYFTKYINRGNMWYCDPSLEIPGCFLFYTVRTPSTIQLVLFFLAPWKNWFRMHIASYKFLVLKTLEYKSVSKNAICIIDHLENIALLCPRPLNNSSFKLNSHFKNFPSKRNIFHY